MRQSRWSPFKWETSGLVGTVLKLIPPRFTLRQKALFGPPRRIALQGTPRWALAFLKGRDVRSSPDLTIRRSGLYLLRQEVTPVEFGGAAQPKQLRPAEHWIGHDFLWSV